MCGILRASSHRSGPRGDLSPAPTGAGGSRVPLSHGFRFARLAVDFAPPVATSLDHFGVKKGTADSVTHPALSSPFEPMRLSYTSHRQSVTAAGGRPVAWPGVRNRRPRADMWAGPITLPDRPKLADPAVGALWMSVATGRIRVG
jgi:hypothetical protein